jgi:hypothetical protein
VEALHKFCNRGLLAQSDICEVVWDAAVESATSAPKERLLYRAECSFGYRRFGEGKRMLSAVQGVTVSLPSTTNPACVVTRSVPVPGSPGTRVTVMCCESSTITEGVMSYWVPSAGKVTQNSVLLGSHSPGLRICALA